MTQNTALITGASQGLGLALTRHLSQLGWRVVVDARDARRLQDAVRDLRGVIAIAGDVTDLQHRKALAALVGPRLDLLVSNASALGASPLPRLSATPLEVLRRTLEVNVVAPLALVQELLPALREAHGTVASLSSDAAVAAYEGWGPYGSSKAALDHLTAVLGVEHPELRCLSVDPGDMRTQLHQDAFPGEDIGDRPLPETVVPWLVRLLLDPAVTGGRHSRDLVVAS